MVAPKGELPARSAKIVCFGEVLLRLAAPSPKLLFQQPALIPTFCGAEANVAANLACFGHQCSLVTVLPNNPVGRAAERALRGQDVDIFSSPMSEGRLGVYYLQPGAMKRPGSVIYDRDRSAFVLADPGRYAWKALLSDADWLFVGGITAALGDLPLRALQDSISQARSRGIKIAFDTNYRPALWQGREDEAAGILLELSREADLLFAGRRATRMMVGGQYDHTDPDDGFKAAAEAMFKASPNLQYMAATSRTIVSSDRQEITALVADRSGMSRSATAKLEQVVDRIGTGDAFASGILHSIAIGASRDDAASFALGCLLWAHSVEGDFMNATLNDIEALTAGTGDVRR